MKVKSILSKLIKLELSIVAEKGPFELFALFSTDDELDDKWDLVVAAAWIDQNTKEALDYLTKQVRSALTPEEFFTISKIVPLDVYDLRVKDIQKQYTTENRIVPVSEYRFYGSRVDKIYLITSKLQINKPLLRLLWPIIIELRRSGSKALDSKEVLKELENRGEKVPPYAMDRIFNFLLQEGCINGPQYIDSTGVREHGAIVITRINPDCQAIEKIIQPLDEQVREFCSLPDNLSRLDFADSMIDYYKNDETKRQAWKYVREILRYPVIVEFPGEDGKNLISVIDEFLGPDIALTLYELYVSSLSGGPDRNPTVPTFILPEDDFISMIRRSNLTDEEKLSLHTLQRKTKENREYIERIKNNV